MEKYKTLDKDLKKIRRKWEYDLYEENLESQKRIDKFYSEEDISENDMICRKYQLKSYLNRRNILFFPIIITIIFGLLVNLVFNKISSIPNFIEMFQKLQSIPITAENMYELLGLYIVLIILIILIVLVFVGVFFIPFPPLYFLVEFGDNKMNQKEYELKLLEKKLAEKINRNKNGEKYVHTVKKKPIKFLIIILILIIVAIIVGIVGKVTFCIVLALIAIGIVIGYLVCKLDNDK